MKKVLSLSICILLAASMLNAAPRKQKVITYEQFGAYGDGVHDDLEAIVEAHEAANEKGLPVRANDKKTYYIGGKDISAVIRTDTDWGKAHFIIDDIKVDNIRQWVFLVKSDKEPYDVKGVKPMHKGDRNIGVKLPCKSLVEVENKNHKVYIREGLNQNSGVPMKEIILADENGDIADRSDIIWNYDQITSAKGYPADDKPITIKGGIFTTVANQQPSKYTYHSRGINILRSNVRVEGLTHYVEGEMDHGAPYRAFIYVDHAANVVVSDCLLTAHLIYTTIGAAKKPVKMGSYDLGGWFAVNVLFDHLRQTTDIDNTLYWGIFASNFCKDLRMNACELSRFDAHMGVANVTLTGCKFGHQGIRMVGFGLMDIENCETRNNALVQLRGDYGSSWEGDIVARNCTIRPQDKNVREVAFLNGYNSGKHDFGYDCTLPTDITIENLTIDDSAVTSDWYTKSGSPVLFSTFNYKAGDETLRPYPAKGKVTLKGYTVASGKKPIVSKNMGLFKGYEVEGL